MRERFIELFGSFLVIGEHKIILACQFKFLGARRGIGIQHVERGGVICVLVERNGAVKKILCRDERSTDH